MKTNKMKTPEQRLEEFKERLAALLGEYGVTMSAVINDCGNDAAIEVEIGGGYDAEGNWLYYGREWLGHSIDKDFLATP